MCYLTFTILLIQVNTCLSYIYTLLVKKFGCTWDFFFFLALRDSMLCYFIVLISFIILFSIVAADDDNNNNKERVDESKLLTSSEYRNQYFSWPETSWYPIIMLLKILLLTWMSCGIFPNILMSKSYAMICVIKYAKMLLVLVFFFLLLLFFCNFY